MITAKLSDIWGLKTVLLTCGAIFLVFSMACGVAQTMTQLYVSDPILASVVPGLPRFYRVRGKLKTVLTPQDRLPSIPRHRRLRSLLPNLRIDP